MMCGNALLEGWKLLFGVGDASHRSQETLRHGGAFGGGWQDEDVLLDFWSEAEDPHDLGYAGTGHALPAGDLGLVVVIPTKVLKESINKTAHAYTDKHLGPKEKIGNIKAADLATVSVRCSRASSLASLVQREPRRLPGFSSTLAALLPIPKNRV